jgi:restriction endonuclease S subunit
VTRSFNSIFAVPPLAEQRALVAKLEANLELAARFDQKLQSKLAEIWGG